MEWIKLLQEISLTINERVGDNMICYDKAKIAENWLGFDSADLEQIEKKEEELGATLPPSYKEFLLTTNGFRQISLFAGSLFPIAEIDWTKNEDPEFLEIFDNYDDISVTDENYFVYGEDQRSEYFKVEYLRETLQVSEWVDGAVIFLKPLIKFGDEWEAWLYANWFPGAHRYRSFRELIEGEFHSTLKLLEKDS